MYSTTRNKKLFHKSSCRKDFIPNINVVSGQQFLLHEYDQNKSFGNIIYTDVIHVIMFLHYRTIILLLIPVVLEVVIVEH
jgi:hypothetical protein